MRKFLIALQIFIFSFQALAKDTGVQSIAQENFTVPKNYKLPQMHLLDSVAFFNSYRDKIGKRMNVQGYSGRFGATFGEDFIRKVYQIERESDVKIEIILTLDATMEDAKIFQQQMESIGRKMVIVTIPEKFQQYVLEKAAAQAEGKITELWWNTKDKVHKVTHLSETLSDAKKIIKNQIVKPTEKEVRLTKVFLAGTAASGAAAFSLGIDPRLATAVLIARLFYTGTLNGFMSSINNLFKTDLLDPLKVISSKRQIASRLVALGIPINESYLLIGRSIIGDSYALTHEQIFAGLAVGGVIGTAEGVLKINKLSASANISMMYYSFAIGVVLETLMTVGMVGPRVLDYGVIQFNTLQTVGLSVSLFTLISTAFFTKQVELFAKKKPLNFIPKAENFFKKVAIAKYRANIHPPRCDLLFSYN